MYTHARVLTHMMLSIGDMSQNYIHNHTTLITLICILSNNILQYAIILPLLYLFVDTIYFDVVHLFLPLDLVV